MQRLFAAIFILAMLLGTDRAGKFDLASMNHGEMSSATCQGGICAAAPGHATPVQDCIQHCLSAASDAAPAAAQSALALAVLALIAITSLRVAERSPSLRGAPAYLMSLLRLRELSTVVMRN